MESKAVGVKPVNPHTTSVRDNTTLIRKLRNMAKEFNDPLYRQAAEAIDLLLVREAGLITEIHDLSMELKKLRDAVAKGTKA